MKKGNNPLRLTKLGRDEHGTILLYFGLMLPVIVGFIGLALDGGAFLHLNTDLQELADAAALAAAPELDGRSTASCGSVTCDAITRATDRAQNLLSNDPHWSNVAKSGVQIETPLTFYSRLNPDVTTTDSTLAAYVKVTTVTRQIAPNFLPAVGGTSLQQTSASAVAGAGAVACNVQPLMLCNPYELTSGDFTATPGQLFHFKQKGSTGGFSPGDFGLLDPPGMNSSGAKTIRNLLSKTTPNFCYVDAVSPRPGQAVNDVSDGINVRFDLNPNGNTSGMELTAAPDIYKGVTPGANVCNANQYSADGTPAINYMLPSAASWGLPIGSLTIGTGLAASKDTYWNYHHGGTWPVTITTRFQAYCNELGLGNDCQGSNIPPPWAGVEPHGPQCLTNSNNYKRRLISVAVVNCVAQNVQGNQSTNVRTNAYAVFFVSHPSPTSQPSDLNDYLGGGPGASTNGDIIAEYVQSITPGGCALNPSSPYCSGLHQIVQLYR